MAHDCKAACLNHVEKTSQGKQGAAKPQDHENGCPAISVKGTERDANSENSCPQKWMPQQFRRRVTTPATNSAIPVEMPHKSRGIREQWTVAHFVG